MKRTLLGALLLLASCTASPPPTYLGTDVVEPDGLELSGAEGVQLQASIFQKGSLTYTGWEELEDVFREYIDAMKHYGWSPSGTEQDPKKRISARLLKDTRLLLLEITRQEDGSTSVSINVGPAESDE